MAKANGDIVTSIFKGNKWVKQKEGHPPGVLTSTTDFPPVTGYTIPEFVFQNTHKWENAPLIKCSETGREYTHGQVYRQSKNFGASLIKRGFEKQDVYCILLPNIPEYPIIAYGILMAGGILSPINPNFTRDEVAHYINKCKGKILLTTPQLKDLAESVRSCCPSLTEPILLIDTEDHSENPLSFQQMVKTDTKDVKFLKGSEINTSEYTAVIMYSSGTTGLPKAVLHSHTGITNILAQIMSPEFNQMETFEEGREQERLVSIVPFFHGYGLIWVMPVALLHGAFIYSVSKFTPTAYRNALIEYKPTILNLVTPLLNFLVQDSIMPREALENCRGVLLTAAPVGKQLMIRFGEKFGHNIFLQEGYGMTEMMGGLLLPKEVHNSRTGCVGVPIPGLTAKVVDVDTGEILGPNKRGEICCYTASIMKGYLGDEEATKFTIREDGFVYSGDIGYYDEQGFFYVVDRLKDLIKVKGLQVAPSELENVLRQHPDIGDVAVIGVYHERFGEAPRAYLVRKNDKLEEQDVHGFMKNLVAVHKQLAGGIEFVDTILKTPSGKILKKDLLVEYKKKMMGTGN